MPARKPSWLALVMISLFAVALIAGGVAFLVWHAHSTAEADRFRAAPVCGLAFDSSGDCVQLEPITITDRSREFANSGTRYDLRVVVTPGGGTATVELVGSSRQTVWNAVQPPMPARGFVWHGKIVEVDLSPTVFAPTAENPLYITGFSLDLGILMLVMGGFYLLLIGRAWRRRFRPVPVTDAFPQTGPMPGALGVPEGLRLGGPLTYRPVSSLLSSLLQASLIEFLACVTVLRFGVDLLTMAIVAWAAVPLAVLYVWWLRGFSLTVTDAQLTYRSHRSAWSVPWSRVGLSTRSGSPYLVVSVAGRTRKIALRRFTAGNPANAGLLNQVTVRIARTPSDDAAALEIPAAIPSVPGAGPLRRLGAWAVDALVLSVIWFVAVAVFGGLSGSHPNGGAAAAVVFGVPVVIVPAYLLCLWRRGCTLGMLGFHLRIADAESGGAPSWRQLWTRFGAVLPWIVTVVPIGIIIGGHRPRHDRVAGTAVTVRLRARGGPGGATGAPPHPAGGDLRHDTAA